MSEKLQKNVQLKSLEDEQWPVSQSHEAGSVLTGADHHGNLCCGANLLQSGLADITGSCQPHNH